MGAISIRGKMESSTYKEIWSYLGLRWKKYIYMYVCVYIYIYIYIYIYRERERERERERVARHMGWLWW